MAIGGAALIIGWLGIAGPLAAPIAIPAGSVAPGSEARLHATQALVRRLGLDPDRLVAYAGPAAGQLAALVTGMAAIPSYPPVASVSYSSPFGVRFDPFTGNRALHAGVDMAGKRGDPVYAAASGTVGTAGWSGAYGNCIEVAHGKGLATRYGHLSAILVHPGDHIAQGDVIARMGSTGRSTGTHLHFEVRVDGRAVDPRPYLDASAAVLAAEQTGVEPVATEHATVEIPAAQHTAGGDFVPTIGVGAAF